MFIGIGSFTLFYFIATYILVKSRRAERVTSNYKEKSMLKNPVVSLRYHLLISIAGVQGATSYIYHAYTSHIHIYCLEFYNWKLALHVMLNAPTSRSHKHVLRQGLMFSLKYNGTLNFNFELWTLKEKKNFNLYYK